MGERQLASLHNARMEDLERTRAYDTFKLNQKVDFGRPDPAFGGAEGGWRCSEVGDTSWHLDLHSKTWRRIASDDVARQRGRRRSKVETKFRIPAVAGA